jgi:glycosyltransferase involved in cell wall biosynthesis
MNIWVVRDCEPIPTDPGKRRLMRIGQLCQTLAARGHDVTWITSTFEHYEKRHRGRVRRTDVMAPNYRIELLPAPGYPRNIGFARVLHNRRFAAAFEAYAAASSVRPDVIVSDIPTTESAASAVKVGNRLDVPTVLSIRDLWPDFFVNHLPPLLRPFAKPLLRPLRRQAKFACRNADALVGISEAYLDWGLTKARRPVGKFDAVVPLGYAPHAVKPENAGRLLADLGVDGSRHVVSFVGTWGATTDLTTVAAAARLLSGRDDIVFVVAGRAERDHPAAAALAACSNVILPGWLDPDHGAALIERTVVGISPYRDDAPQGLPNKVFAYMSHGTFQVTTLDGEAVALLERNGLGVGVPAADPQAMATAIAEAIDTGTAAEGRARVAAYFAEHFSHDRVFGKLSEIIETVRRRQT